MELYTFFRSSAAYRVRIALNLKGLETNDHYIHLRRDGGEQKKSAYLKVNPQALVPTLIDGPLALSQSLAILEYLNEKHPKPSIVPDEITDRALARSFALAIACDIHPLNNLRVLQYLGGPMGHDTDQRDDWYRHWAGSGLEALEKSVLLAGRNGTFMVGDTPTLADICLVPQMYNARRFDTDLTNCPTLVAIDAACQAIDAFARAVPESQPDAE
jgi:maleylacetoacetate isomerase